MSLKTSTDKKYNGIHSNNQMKKQSFEMLMDDSQNFQNREDSLSESKHLQSEIAKDNFLLSQSSSKKGSDTVKDFKSPLNWRE